MNSKKISFAFLAILMVSVFAISLASAAETDNLVSRSVTTIANTIDGALQGSEPLLKYLIGSEMIQTGNTVPAFLMLLLVFLVIYGILSPMHIFGENEGINLSIAAIVSILGVRFLPTNLVEVLTTPSSALFAIIVLGTPMLILYAITTKSGSAAKKFSKFVWWAYAILMLVILLIRWNELTSIVRWVFAAAIVLAVLFAVYLIKIFRDLTEELRITSASADKLNEIIEDLHQEKIKLEEKVASGVADADTLNDKVEKLNKRIERLRKQQKKAK